MPPVRSRRDCTSSKKVGLTGLGSKSCRRPQRTAGGGGGTTKKNEVPRNPRQRNRTRGDHEQRTFGGLVSSPAPRLWLPVLVGAL